MGQIFGKEKPLKEVLRENKRMINRAVRELDREKLALEREEKRLTMEIKKAAKEGQMPSVKIMAKVRKGRKRKNNRGYRTERPRSCCSATRLTLSLSLFFFKKIIIIHRTWFALDNTLPNSLKCDHTCKGAPSNCKPSNPIKPWPRPCRPPPRP
jgi:hypothetical protein